MLQEIERLFRQGRYSDIASLISAASGEVLSSLPAGPLLQSAVASSIAGHHELAERLYLDLLARYPSIDEARLNLGVLRLQQQRYAEAYALLSDYLSRNPGEPNGLYNLAVVRFAMGQYRESAQILELYLRQFPQDASAKVYLARCAIELEDHEAAQRVSAGLKLEMLDGLREWYEFARLLSALEQGEAAAGVYRQIVMRYPDELPARINLAMLHERTNKTQEGLQLLDGIESRAKASHHYWLARARLLGATGQPTEAIAAIDRAEQLLSVELSEAERDSLLSEMEFERGHNLDKLKRDTEAFAAFAKGNDLARQRYRRIAGSRQETIESFRYQDDSSVDALVKQRYRSDAAPDSPIFLVGFPRSGTTLLDQILDGHEALQVMEEKPALETVAQALEARFGSVGEALRQADGSTYREMQALYWAFVARHLQRKPSTRLVDKYPLSIARLQLGMALFPRARWIFAIRHPCDVVLSCFMQNFRFTQSTLGFWSLEQTAEIYVRTMALWLDQRARLQPTCLDIRYEDLVHDLEGQARRLLNYLQLPWDPRVLQYREHAKTRRIGTPSYRQVVQPIYKTAQGRWVRYREQMDEVLPLLAPLVDRLGYSVETNAGS